MNMANTLMKGRPDPEWRLPLLVIARSEINRFEFFDKEWWVKIPAHLGKWLRWAENCQARLPERSCWNNGPWVSQLLYTAAECGAEVHYLISVAKHLATRFKRSSHDPSWMNVPIPQESWDAHTIAHQAVTAWLDWATWKVALSSDPKEIFSLFSKMLQVPWRNTRKGNPRNAGTAYTEYGEALYYFRQTVGLQLQNISKDWRGWEGRLKRDRRLRKIFWELNAQDVPARDPAYRHNEAGIRRFNRHNQPPTSLHGWTGGLQKESSSSWYRAYVTNEDGTLLIESPFRFQHEVERTYNSQIRPLPHGHLIPTPLYSEGKFWGISFDYISNGQTIWGWEVRLNASNPIFSRYRRNPGNPPSSAIRQGDVWLVPVTLPKETCTFRVKEGGDWNSGRLTDSMAGITKTLHYEAVNPDYLPGGYWYHLVAEGKTLEDYHWNFHSAYIQAEKLQHPDHPSISLVPDQWYLIMEVGGVTTPWPRRGQQGD
jgi:hypothetical protein